MSPGSGNELLQGRGLHAKAEPEPTERRSYRFPASAVPLADDPAALIQEDTLQVHLECLGIR